MNSEKRNLLQLIMGCISMIKAAFMALQNRIEIVVREVTMTMDRIGTIFQRLFGKKTIATIAIVALFLVIFVFPVSATEDLPNALGRLIDYNKVKIIKIVVTVAVITHVAAFLKGGTSVKTIDIILEAIIVLVVGAFFFYNWKDVVNYVLSYIPDFSDFL